MRSSARVAIVSVIAGALSLAGIPAQAQAVWSVVPSPNEPGRNFLYGADASDASHVWAVGRVLPDSATTSRSLLLRYDGTAWRPAPRTGFPSADALYDVDAPSANDAWAAGTYQPSYALSRTLVAHWNGATWTAVATPNANPASYNSLSGIVAVPNGAGAVWAVGTYGEAGSAANRRALILQRTGGAWSIAPAPRVTISDFLEAVDATGPADAWAVGFGSNGVYGTPTTPIVLRWNGAVWRSTPLPTTGTTLLYGVAALAPDNVWVVGTTTAVGAGWVPFTARFDGTSWRRVPTPTVPLGGRLNDVVATAPSNVYAVGTTGDGKTLVLRWNGVSWVREATPSPSTNTTLTGAALVGRNTVWAVGYRSDPTTYAERTITIRSAP